MKWSLSLAGGRTRLYRELQLAALRGLLFSADAALADRWRWLSRSPPNVPARILDAGCGRGTLALYAALQGNVVIGLTSAPLDAKVAQRRAQLLGVAKSCDFLVRDLRHLADYQAEIGQFDEVWCFEVIEHILQDRRLVYDLVESLRPRGVLRITCPYRYYRPLPGDRISPHEDGGHVRWGYTRAGLEELLRGSGAQIISADYITGFVGQKIIAMQRRMEQRIGPTAARVITLPARALRPFDASISRWARYPFLSIAVVARRMVLSTPESRAD